VAWLPTAANSTTTPTLAINGLTAKTITKCGQLALFANDIITTAIAYVAYDGTGLELLNPMTGSCGGSLYDVNGKPTMISTAVANAVDYINVTNAAAGSPGVVSYTTAGSDNDISLRFIPKGLGTIDIGSAAAAQFLNNGTINKYGTLATAGNGATVNFAVANSTNQSASIVSTGLFTPGAVEQVRVNYYLDEKTPCTTASAGGVSLTLTWTDQTLARSFTSATLSADTSGVASDYIQGSVVIYSTSSQAISYSTTYTATCGTGTFAYDLHLDLERLQ
jgi:hypothetical protein